MTVSLLVQSFVAFCQIGTCIINVFTVTLTRKFNNDSPWTTISQLFPPHTVAVVYILNLHWGIQLHATAEGKNSLEWVFICFSSTPSNFKVFFPLYSSNSVQQFTKFFFFNPKICDNFIFDPELVFIDLEMIVHRNRDLIYYQIIVNRFVDHFDD